MEDDPEIGYLVMHPVPTAQELVQDVNQERLVSYGVICMQCGKKLEKLLRIKPIRMSHVGGDWVQCKICKRTIAFNGHCIPPLSPKGSAA